MRPVVLDLFAGAGGFGLGFKAQGFDVPLSLEIDQWACDTLRHNHPEMMVIQDDIRRFATPPQIKEICPFSPDVIIGGPPCQGFSISGPAQKDPKDPRNALFNDFARWVEVLQPSVFVMENVKGLLSRRNAQGEKVIQIIEQVFARLGYCVNVWLLNAAEYGVPQVRERIFIVGTASKPLPPPPQTYTIRNHIDEQASLFDQRRLLPAISLWEAISDLPSLEAGQGEEALPYSTAPTTDYQHWARLRADCLYNHVAMDHTPRLVERFKLIQWGESSAEAPKDHYPRRRNGNGEVSAQAYDQNNRRLHPYKPSHTIAASFYANFLHPFQHRNLTAREGARIQSFPDHYRFLGKKTVVSHKLLHREGRLEEVHLCQYNQIGNAVPPLLAQHIAAHIAKECFDAPSW